MWIGTVWELRKKRNQDLSIALQLAHFVPPPQSPLNKGGCRRQGGKCEQISDNRVSPNHVLIKKPIGLFYLLFAA
jgi:hypothetical protein